jgi:2-succinyl-6-hydroxy-2,4-cyclohexadiene-1-carboxylate synthase
MEPLWDHLGEIQVPTLLLTGERDRAFELIAMGMLAELSNAQHRRVLGVGHCAHFEAPDEFSRIYRASD